MELLTLSSDYRSHMTLTTGLKMQDCAGHSAGSSGSHETGREITETQDLSSSRPADSLKSALVLSEPSSNTLPQSGLQLRRIGHRPLQSSLKGPRRIGMLFQQLKHADHSQPS